MYKNHYLNTPAPAAAPAPAPATLDTHAEVKELLIDHSPVPQPNLHTTETTTSSNESNETEWTNCLHLPGAENILIILKTGATAIYDRLPIHFESTFKCVPNYIIISDLEQTIGPTKVHDVLQLVTQQTRENHQDFDLYYDIADYHASGQDPSKLPGSAAWNLDKWKFLPMIHKAWDVSQTEYNGKIDWFVMMEADTSLSWLNLIHFLQTKDPSIPQYIGSPAMLVVDGSTFAHGGSGVIMSRAAISKVEHKRTHFLSGNVGESVQASIAAYDRFWEKHTEDICCGDAVLAHAFTDVGVAVSSARPMIQGDTPLTIPWELPDHTRPDSMMWCKTPITFHHVNGGEVDELYQFQQHWVEDHNGGLWNETYLFKDIFEEFISPHIEHGRSTKSEWDNMSSWIRIESSPEGISVSGPEIRLASSQEQEDLDTITSTATENAEKCEKACERRGWPHFWPQGVDDCLQWKWSEGKCFLDYKIRLGEVQDDETIKKEGSWTSGWMKERVLSWKVKQGSCGRPETQKEEIDNALLVR